MLPIVVPIVVSSLISQAGVPSTPPPLPSSTTTTPTAPSPAPPAAAPATKTRVLVMPIAAAGVGAAEAAEATRAVVERLDAAAARAGLEVLTLDELTQLGDMAQRKAVLGATCSAEDASCAGQILAWSKAELVVNGTLGMTGSTVTLSLVVLENVPGKPPGARARDSIAVAGADIAGAARTLTARVMGWRDAGVDEVGPRFSFAKGQKLSFAVLPLESAGVAPDVAKNLTEILAVEVKKIDGASVLGLDDVAALLAVEEKKQVLSCTADSSCLAEIGSALGVQKLIVGKIGKVDEQRVVSLRLLDTASVRVDARVSETFRADDDQYLRAVRHAARRLLGVGEGAEGTLLCTSSQEGAGVFIDDVERGSTPLSPLRVPAGKHAVRLVKDGFFDWQSEVYVDPGETTAQWTVLEERPKEWWQQWWVWAGAGTAAVVLGTATTGAVWALFAPKSPPTGTVIANVPPLPVAP